MPRIPEGRFNKTPSVRVEAQRVPVPQGGGITTALKAAENITSAMAKLEDQRERTDAYNAANEVKREYEQEKARISLNLENVDGKGNYNYADPLSEDAANPEIRSGNIKQDMDNLEKFYATKQSDLGNLTRSDIASDLTQQYVGDDINLLKVRAGKAVIKQSQKEQTSHLLDNLGGAMVKVLDLSASNTNPALLDAQVTSSLNQIDREIAMAAPSIGMHNVDKAKQLKQRLIGKTAGDVLSTGLSENSIKVAGMLIERIDDPLAKRNAEIKMDGIRATETRRVEKMVTSGARKYAANILASGYVDGETMLKAKEMSDSLKTAYMDPKHTTITPEERNESLLQLNAAILSKHSIQENIDQTEDIMALNQAMQAQFEIDEAIGQGRSPSAKATSSLAEAEQKMNDFLDRSLASSGIRDLASSPEEKMKLFELAKPSLKNLYVNLKDNIATIRASKYPNESTEKRNAYIAAKFEELKLGDPVFVPEQSINAFRSKIKTDIKKQDGSTIDTLSRAMDGSNQETARAIITDLTKGDKKLQSLIVASDYLATGNGSMANMIATDIEKVSTQEVDIDSKREIENVFLSKVDKTMQLDMQANQTLSGLKDAIVNRARVIATEEGESLGSAMEQAIETFKKDYLVRKSRDGKHLLTGVNTKNGADYTDDQSIRQLDIGAGLTVRNLPTVSLEDKRAIAMDYLGLSEEQARTSTDNSLALFFNENFTIQPDPRQINVHRIVYKGVHVSTRDGKVLEYSMDDIIETGRVPSTIRSSVLDI